MRLNVNGVAHDLAVPSNRLLLDVLREDLNLTGTKLGCGVGVCGLCSVLVDGELVSACLTLAASIEGADVTTIEGIQHPRLQQAFIDHAGFQCGICTPGQIVSASALLAEYPHPSTQQIKDWMTGNLCRCTGYLGIVESIQGAINNDNRAEPSPREDGPDKVHGATRYAADIRRPGMLYGRILRSPYPHARIISIATRKAREQPGVKAVLTGKDIPADVRVGRNMRDMPVLARDKVRFVGEKVAAIAAETPELAEAALNLITVEYEELPAVFDPLEAIQPGAPLIHDKEETRNWAERDQVVPDYPNGASAPSWGASQSDVEAALARSHRVFEHTFHTPMQHQAYLEPHTCTVEIDGEGIVHIWASNKAPLLLARYLREGLGLQRDQLNLHMLPLGGDFGGKGSFMDIPLAYFLACASGRPVRMTMSYSDELSAGNPRHAATIVVRSGVDREGRLVARWVRGYFASGGYAAFKPSTDTTLPGFKRGAVGPYHIPVHRAECHMVYTNTVPCGHMRSPGEAQVAFAIEAHTELIAREFGLDPVEFRRRNLTHEARPSESSGIEVLSRGQEVLATAAEAIGWQQPRPPGVGRGLALVEFSTSPGVYGGILRLDPNGRVTIQTPIIEQGAGMLTVFRRIVADELQLPLDQVSIRQSVDGIEDDRGVGGSRTTRLVGKLLIQLSKQLLRKLSDLVAAEFGDSPESIRYAEGRFIVPPGRAVTFLEAAALATEPIVESHLFRPTARDRSSVAIALAAEVCSDAETGAVTPRRLITVQEVGRVIDPLLFKRQIEGGVLQGLGYALMENLVLQDGRVQNANLHEYKIPTQSDIPSIEVILVGKDPSLGITPVGEGASAGVAPAIINALIDLTGVRQFDIPITPEAVFAKSPIRAEAGPVDRG